MHDGKEVILKLIWKLVFGFFGDMAAIRVATLGGKGLEAGIWKDADIPKTHGHLIERAKEESEVLIAGGGHGYRYCNSLRHFPRAMGGQSALVDGFHLDVCGTLEPKFDDFAPMLPMILRGRGKCLAITVTEERRNRSLEHFDKVLTEVGSLIGPSAARRLFDSLLKQHRQVPPLNGHVAATDSPEKATKREFGLLLNFYKLLRSAATTATLPEVIHRYVYLSQYSGSTCRMRTYFFHFGDEVVKQGSVGFSQLSAYWINSSLNAVSSNGELITVNKTRATRPTPKKENQMKRIQPTITAAYSNLIALATAAGGTCKQELDTLLALAEDAKLIAEFRQLLSVGQQTHSSPPTVPPPPAPTDSTTPVSVINELDVRLELLRGKAQGKEAYQAAFSKGLAGLKLRRKQAGKRRLGGLFATTHGKFRGQFVNELIAAGRESVLPELTALYGLIDGGSHSVESFKHEAGEAASKAKTRGKKIAATKRAKV